MKINRFLVLILLLFSILSSCSNNNQTLESEFEVYEAEYQRYIQKIRENQKRLPKVMAEKGIELTYNGPCDDALGDTIHIRAKAYIDAIKIDDEIIVSFKFYDTCCQGYLADYCISADTMIIDLGLISEESCDCLCWYRYKYKVKYTETKINHIKINDVR